MRLKSMVKAWLGRAERDPLVGHLHQCDAEGVSGWIVSPNRPSRTYEAALHVDGQEVTRVPAHGPVPAAAPAPPVPGAHGFQLAPRPYLEPGRHSVLDVLMVDNLGIKTPLGRGHAGTLDLAEIDSLLPEAIGGYLARSQERWRRGEGGASLTWGRLMTGDTFMDAVQQTRPLRDTDVILEIGPGYGRLLQTILERGLPFQRYVGLDISPEKVATLQQRFGSDPRIQFQQCDVISGPIPPEVTVVLCSGTLEHLFPNVRGLLANLRARIVAPFVAFLDFKADERFMRSMAWFEQAGGAFVRTYLRDELETLLGQAGYRVLRIPEIVLGKSLDDIDVRRFLVIAEGNA